MKVILKLCKTFQISNQHFNKQNFLFRRLRNGVSVSGQKLKISPHSLQSPRLQSLSCQTRKKLAFSGSLTGVMKVRSCALNTTHVKTHSLGFQLILVILMKIRTL